MRIIGLTAAGILMAASTSALAGTYEALCGDVECQIDVSARGISSPAGFTPSGLVSQWAVGNATDFNAGKAVAGGLGGATAGFLGGAILLGPIGALAGLAGGAVAGAGSGKEFEGYFSIVGFNKKGQKISHSFYFINDKPVKRLLTELPLFTGLAQREERDIQAIETAFTSGNVQLRMGDGLPSQLGMSSGQTTANTRPITQQTAANTRPITQQTAANTRPITQQISSSIRSNETINTTVLPTNLPLSKEKCKDGKPKVNTQYKKVCPEDLSKRDKRMLGKGRKTRPG